MLFNFFGEISCVENWSWSRVRWQAPRTLTADVSGDTAVILNCLAPSTAIAALAGLRPTATTALPAGGAISTPPGSTATLRLGAYRNSLTGRYSKAELWLCVAAYASEHTPL